MGAVGYIYAVQSFPCLVKLSLAVLGWTTHLVLEHEGWDTKRSYERVPTLELPALQECGGKRKKCVEPEAGLWKRIMPNPTV